MINITYDTLKGNRMGEKRSLLGIAEYYGIKYKRIVDKNCTDGIYQYCDCESIPENLPDYLTVHGKKEL